MENTEIVVAVGIVAGYIPVDCWVLALAPGVVGSLRNLEHRELSIWVEIGCACCLLMAPRPVFLYRLLPNMLAHRTAVRPGYPEDMRRHPLYQSLVPWADTSSRQEFEDNWHTVSAENPEHWHIGPVDRDGSDGTSCCIPGQFVYTLSNPRASSSFPMHIT